MTFQERVMKLENYRPDITFKDGAFILKIRFNRSWRVIEPQDKERIAFAKDNNTEGLYWYVAHIEDVDELFDLIDETIEVNQELERKRDLYKSKVDELKELFLSDITYEKLCTLEFTFAKQKKEKAQKRKKTEPKSIESLDVADEPQTVETAESEIDIKVKQALGGK